MNIQIFELEKHLTTKELIGLRDDIELILRERFEKEGKKEINFSKIPKYKKVFLNERE